uniref:Uncharacterized protein n=1 Tax=Anopheles minimus TaxID=112268 RepID=A0A182WPZ8_9DIPT
MSHESYQGSPSYSSHRIMIKKQSAKQTHYNNYYFAYYHVPLPLRWSMETPSYFQFSPFFSLFISKHLLHKVNLSICHR